jgi:hypothetical protein
MKLGTYIMAPHPTLTTYYMSLPSVCVTVYIYPLIVARQRVGRNVIAAANTRAVRVVSQECTRTVLPRTSYVI